MSTKQQWERAGKKWRKVLKLEGIYDIKYKYVDNLDIGGAVTIVQSNYYQATIKVDQTELARINFDQMNWLSCHEHVHILIASYDELISSMLTTMNSSQATTYKDWVHTLTEQIVENLTKIMISK